MPGAPNAPSVACMTTMLANSHTTVTVCGVLDSGCVPRLKRRLRDTARSATGALVLDLSAVTACDYGVLELLLHAQAVCADRGIALHVLPSPAVRHLMSREY